jgi:pimeloyl-ACP methyl ester carboxylesterase
LWGRKTDHTLIAPERPGFGLSTYKSKYTIPDHAEDVQTLMDHLGHRRYKTWGTSGGAPYALVLNMLASTNEVSGTLLVVPSSPPESSQTGHSISSFGYTLLSIFAPKMLELILRKRNRMPLLLKGIEDLPIQDRLNRLNREYRKTEKGRRWLTAIEGNAKTPAWVADLRASNTHWGFDLTDVIARNIEIFAAGMDVHTPISGARWMRNRLRNCRLHECLDEDHLSLQKNKYKEIMRALQYLHIRNSSA